MSFRWRLVAFLFACSFLCYSEQEGCRQRRSHADESAGAVVKQVAKAGGVKGTVLAAQVADRGHH